VKKDKRHKTEKQNDRQTDRQTDRKTDRQKDRKKLGFRDGRTGRESG
jgi:hypothetical protein